MLFLPFHQHPNDPNALSYAATIPEYVSQTISFIMPLKLYPSGSNVYAAKSSSEGKENTKSKPKVLKDKTENF